MLGQNLTRVIVNSLFGPCECGATCHTRACHNQVILQRQQWTARLLKAWQHFRPVLDIWMPWLSLLDDVQLHE